VYRSTFTFLQGGHFEVAFSARADGSAVRGDRAVVVGDQAGTLPPSPAAEAPSPPPANNPASNSTPGARWL
jgi:hypothetical protein